MRGDLLRARIVFITRRRVNSFDAEQAANGDYSSIANFYSTSSESVEKLGRRCLLSNRNLQRVQPLVEWGGRVVADVGDASAVKVNGCERLQHIVELRRRERDGDGLIAAHAT